MVRSTLHWQPKYRMIENFGCEDAYGVVGACSQDVSHFRRNGAKSLGGYIRQIICLSFVSIGLNLLRAGPDFCQKL